MPRTGFDRFCWLVLFSGIVSAGVLCASGTAEKKGAGIDKAAGREMAYRARIELVTRLYGPIDALRASGKGQHALLKLAELIRTYPGEAHGHILQGAILMDMGAFDEAVSSYTEGVRLNGDYIDKNSPLSRRGEIQRLVTDGLQQARERSLANPDNRSAAQTLQRLNYLKSRLAGGCE